MRISDSVDESAEVTVVSDDMVMAAPKFRHYCDRQSRHVIDGKEAASEDPNVPGELDFR